MPDLHAPHLDKDRSQSNEDFLQLVSRPDDNSRADVLRDLLFTHCCARCCLRFSSIRGELHSNAYAKALPSSAQLLQLLQPRQRKVSSDEALLPAQTLQTGATEILCASEGTSLPGASSLPKSDSVPSQNGHHSGQKHSPSSQSSGAACSVCLGVLESLDTTIELAAEDLISALIEPPGGQGHWQALDSGEAFAIWNSIR